MKFLTLPTVLLSLGLAFVGCAVVRTHQAETTNRDGSVTRETDFKARTFFDSKNDLSKMRTTMTDKSQGVAVSGLEQESSGSNATALAGVIVEAAIKAAVKSVVPIPTLPSPAK